ncbi:MAG TPA: Uma2 family endonuclease [Isosphaeraceae bacterium]|nr:Uma2 family endonuclease [Isosphaeraceae bacterium]
MLSKGNTKPEMTRKLQEYFEAGVRSVWMVNARKRTARLYTAVDQSVLLAEDQLLDGGTILPGFVLPVRELFVKDEP